MADWQKSSATNHNQRLMALLKNGLGNPYDVMFVMGPELEEVKAHQFILRLHSPVFEEKFKPENQPSAVVGIEDGNKQDFELFLQILYTGVMCDQPKQATKLLQYAVEFQVLDLEEWCWKSLEQITEESPVTVYELATKFGKKTLRDQALEFILTNASTILDSDEFLKFTSPNLFQVMASDELAATDETQVFKAVLRWGKEMCRRDSIEPTGSALRNVLTYLLPMVRFPVMSKSDFSLLVAPLELLTDKELISILLYFNIDKNKRNDIPPGAFNGKERNWVKKREPVNEHVLYRLEPIPNNQAFPDERLDQTRFTSFIELISQNCIYIILQLRFSVDHPIWITSLGVNAGSQYLKHDSSSLPNSSEIKFEIGLLKKVAKDLYLPIAAEIRTVRVAQLNKTLQLHFFKPIQIEPLVCYTLQFRAVQGIYFPQLYKCSFGSDGENLSIFVEGKTINFRFEEVPGQDPAVIGLTQGFIPTIGFKLHDPDAQE